METFQLILYGFSVVLQPGNLMCAFLGAIAGTLVGVLPGLGPVGAMSMLLPVTYGMSPTGAMIMLAGIYYGAQYGGSTTSILVNIPGESASVVTCLDGYQMARQGRAGPALGIAAFGSFIAGSIGVLGLSFLAPPLVDAALTFGAPEYFALMCLGLTVLTFLAHGSMLKALIMAVLGLFVGTIGIDITTGIQRFTLGNQDLMEGVGLVQIAMGMFGISEILLNIEKTMKVSIFETKLKGLFPNLQDWRRSIGAILRGTGIGFFLGILPGGGAVIASFTSYAIERRLSRHPDKFGSGIIEGVAAPESANNAAAQGAFIPLMTLGVPSNVVMALLLGALMIHGLTPGPLLMSRNPDLFWGVITSMYVGNLMLLVLNLPLIPMWVKFLKIPYPILFPFILLFCLIGVYTINNNIFDIYLMIFFGIVGYLAKKFEFEPAPFILAVVLGPMMEKAFRQSLIMFQGDFSIFITRPISGVIFGIAIVLLILPLFAWGSRREKIASLKDED
ncbi:MAG TPA: tripartite tricarboxylate transporter permease [Thermodesulfobacteriota bacterium]|nr:tripartite tricarboxylate transporter permease [Thermodesulfobacteriota bacterium]